MSEASRNFSRYRTVGEAAEFLGVTAATLRNWDRNGKLKPRRHPQNGYRIYLHEELEAVLRSADQSLSPDDSFAPLVDWSDMRETEHFVQFYEHDDFLANSASGFLASALGAGQCGVLIATAEHRTAILQALTELDIDPSQAVADGRFAILDAAETLAEFMCGDAPDARRFNEIIGGVIARLAEGDRRIHAFGEMVALLWMDGKRDAAVRLENLWHELGKSHSFALCCGYPTAGFADSNDGDSLDGVCKCHTRVIPSESYSSIDDPFERLRAITLLQQKAKSLEAEIGHRNEVDKVLSRKERELADFFDNATEGLHKVGPDGRIIWANRAELALLGYSSDEYIGHHITEFHVDKETIDEILQRLSRGDDLFNQPARLLCKDGSVKDVLINSNGYFEEGRFFYSRCFTRDVTEIKRAERDRAMLAAIVESSDDAVISKSLDGIIRSWNAGAERLFGYSESEAVGRPVTLIIPPERIGEEAEILERLRRGERITHFETVRVTKSGKLIDISLTISPIRDGRGTLIGASKIARDITDRKRDQAALRESEDRYRRLAELLPVAVYTCEAASGTITYFNNKAAEIWGRTPELGVSDERFCGSLELYLPDGTFLPHDQCPMARALHDGCSFRNQEVSIKRPDGSRVIALVNIEPIRNASGEVTGAINVFLDISALKEAQSALRDQKENLQALLETLPVAVFIAEDPDCRVIFGNPAAAELLRTSREDNHSKTAPPDEQPAHFQVLHEGQEVPSEKLPVQRAARGEIVRAEEVDHQFSDGALIHTIVSARPLYDSQDRPRGAVACMMDVSELKRAEVALREADRRKDEFLATLAHELRNPLAPIRNGLALLRLGAGDETLARETQAIMERQVEHMTRLVDDLLDVSRITRNKIELRKQRVTFAEIVKSAVEASRPLIDAANHEFVVSLPTESIVLDADPTRMAQIFSNLLNNSAKYTESGGRISLQAKVHAGELVVAVQDNGIGISCEALAYVFDMFRQAHPTLDRSQSGLGIGLTLVRRLVELHGGTINAHSEGLGKGSTFTVRLPIAVESRIVDQGAPTAIQSKTPKRRILVVDDNRDSVTTLSALLKIKGNEVRTASDGLEAIEVSAEFQPEVILMDVGMPKLDGYEATRRLRQMPCGKDIFIVILSGWGQAEDLQKSHEAGGSAHLTKPVDFAALDALLAKAIPNA